MKRTRRLKLNFWQSVSHYWLAFFPLIVPISQCYSLIKYYYFENYVGVRTPEELASGGVYFVLISLLIFLLQYLRLRFKIINILITNEEFNEAVKRTAEELKWKILSKGEFHLEAVRESDLIGIHGELITIFYEGNQLYMNVIPNPNTYASITTLGWSKINKDIFIQNLRKVNAGHPADVIHKKVGFMPKWTFWAVVVRIFLYPLALALIAMSIFIFSEGFSLNILAGLALLAVATTFLITDIKLMFGKNTDK